MPLAQSKKSTNEDLLALLAELDELSPGNLSVICLRHALRMIPLISTRTTHEYISFQIWQDNDRPRNVLTTLRGLQSALLAEITSPNPQFTEFTAIKQWMELLTPVEHVIIAHDQERDARAKLESAQAQAQEISGDLSLKVQRARRVTAATTDVTAAELAAKNYDAVNILVSQLSEAQKRARDSFESASKDVGTLPKRYPIDAARAFVGAVKCAAQSAPTSELAAWAIGGLFDDAGLALALGSGVEDDLRLLRPRPTSLIKRFLGETPRGVSPSELLRRPLWRAAVPKLCEDAWLQFQSDLLALDETFEVWIDWYRSLLIGNLLNIATETEIATLSLERLDQTVPEINAIIKSIRGGSVQRLLNRARAIFVGGGGAGKTSVIKALHGEEVVEGRERTTEGISIHESDINEKAGVATRELSLDERNMIVHFWDFGGQIMVHATHQFFLRAHCIYVVVLEARPERNANEEAEYWLEHIKAFGGNAPTFLVGNKVDSPAKVALDIQTLQIKYPNVIGFYPVSCTQAKSKHKPEFDRFKRDFFDAVSDMGRRGEHFTEQQFRVLVDVRAKAQVDDFLSHDDFERICQQNGIPEDGPHGRNALLALFDRLGIVMHFPELPYLTEYVLNPKWLTFGVYAVMFSRRASGNDGRISEREIVQVLRGANIQDDGGRVFKYPPQRSELIVNTMLAFRIAYRLPKSHSELVIPSLLDANRPRHLPPLQQPVSYRLRFNGFLPRQILPITIVDNSVDISQVDNKQLVWQGGVVFETNRGMNAKAVIMANYLERSLSVEVSGPDASAYLGLLRDGWLRVLKTMPDLRFQEQVLVRPDMRSAVDDALTLGGEPFWASFDMIRTAQKLGYESIPGEDGYAYDLKRILAIVPISSAIRHHEVLISYAHKDRKIVNALAGEIEHAGHSVWFDRDLIGGQMFREIIKQRINASKAVIVVWTESSVVSEFVIAEADLARAQGKLVPVMSKRLSASDIPLPFGNIHTMLLGDRKNISEALARLGVGRPRG